MRKALRRAIDQAMQRADRRDTPQEIWHRGHDDTFLVSDENVRPPVPKHTKYPVVIIHCATVDSEDLLFIHPDYRNQR